MVTVDPAALEHVLHATDLRTSEARRERVTAGGLLPLVSGAAHLVYVVSGAIRHRGSRDSACHVDIDRASRTASVDAHPAPPVLTTGDAFFTLGRESFVLDATVDTELLVVELELSDGASLLATSLPEPITVTGFDVLEPAAAALAGNMGTADAKATHARDGDPVICQLMAKTVLLSVIRAWVERGCAPAGWPTLQTDPFLDRVVYAIHDAPGDEWTVQRLASVGAMSRSVFAERFRAVIGRSPADYVAEVRIAEAKRMLDEGRSVSETSRALGYASDEGFSRAFRRRTGVTPSSWRSALGSPVPA